MGRPTGFLDYPRVENPYRDEKARLDDYEDLHVSQPEAARRCQASRCMNCGVPFCQSDFGCPLHNLIPEWNDLLCRGQEKQALARLLETAPFPEFTGRVCPALCEKACNLADDGVTNRDNELYLIERGFEMGWIVPRRPAARTGKCVAVVGSGPAGLAAADLLNQMGHSVTVFERADRPGGLLMYGIPNMKLHKAVVHRRIALMEAEGVAFALNMEADPEMLEGFDAALLCTGARQPRPIGAQTDDVNGVHFAVDYLTAATRALLGSCENVISAAGKNVIVVGGGDTGNDCVGTALRQHCKRVMQLEMMPSPPEHRAAGNPWPQWPRTLRTDYGQLEAIQIQGSDPRVYRTTVKRIIAKAGEIQAVETVKLDGFESVPETEQIIPCSLLLIAAGFVGCERATAQRFGLSLSPKGTLMPENGGHRVGGRLFSAGDARTGQSLVVRALADGRAAAREIDRYLRGEGA